MPIIVLDPAHGGEDIGAISKKGLLEKDVTLAIALKTAEYLRQVGVDVRLTRTIDQSMNLSQRTQYANNIGADLFICIHINEGGGTGFESYIYTTVSDTATIFANNTMHRKLAGYFNNFGLADRGEKRGDFFVLRDTLMPASILECGFMDHPVDAELLSHQGFIYGLALSLSQSIANVFGYPEPSRTAKQISNYYMDVVEGMEHAQHYIDFLFEKGIMLGDGKGHFMPLDSMNRMTFAIILGRAIEYLKNEE
ncbi:MAG TPA: N-acetylmuramoyl-L-alanine amidase [Paenibacillaceae bacterium]|nr:N-acetylmuramoyl-L-alanine amidase [Paenibacillaceae bacterium]